MLVFPYKGIKNPLSTEENKNNEIKDFEENKKQQEKLSNPNNKYSNLRTLFPVLIIFVALPLIVLASLQKQNISQEASTLDCNSSIKCTTCSSPSNTCSFGNGRQNCTYQTHTSGSSCKPFTLKQVYCYKPNCSKGFICDKQKCVDTKAKITPVPSKTNVPTPTTIMMFR